MTSFGDCGRSMRPSKWLMDTCRLVSGAAATALLLMTPAMAAEPKELRVTIQLPPGSIETNNLLRFKKHVEAGTQGDLKVSIFPSGQLVEDSQVVKAVAAGRVEMGASRLGNFAEAVPATGIFMLPFMFHVPAVEEAAMNSGSPVRGPLDAAILQRTGTRVLWWQPLGSFVLLSKGGPITTPAAMAGKTVRVFDESSTALVQACGGVPIKVAGNDMYEAHRTGRVEVAQLGLTGVVARRLWEVMDNLTSTRHITDALLIVINESIWQSLPADHRRILEEAAGEAQKTVWAELRKVDVEVDALANKHGTTVTNLSNEQVLEWKICAEALLESFLEKSGPTGARVMAGYRKVLTDAYRTPAPLPVRQ